MLLMQQPLNYIQRRSGNYGSMCVGFVLEFFFKIFNSIDFIRAMAMCMALMFGRLGGVSGSNIVAYFLNDNCEIAFYLSGSSLIVCAILSSLIPNIHQRAPKKETQLQPRSSVMSTTHPDPTTW